MDIAAVIFVSSILFTAIFWGLVRAFGGSDEKNTTLLATTIGFILALLTYFGGPALIPLPLLFVFSLLLFHYDMGIARTLGIVTIISACAYGTHYGLRPLLELVFGS